MTVRLDTYTHKGHGELIKEHFGVGWPMISVITLFVSAVGALLTEFVGIGGVGEMFHIPLWVSVPFVTLLLIAKASMKKERIEQNFCSIRSFLSYMIRIQAYELMKL
ncbi:MAG: hypothetical protein NVSMB49_19360 [Ktedonobacteraceae bacterium]